MVIQRTACHPSIPSPVVPSALQSVGADGATD
jgi:hypothetical protein